MSHDMEKRGVYRKLRAYNQSISMCCRKGMDFSPTMQAFMVLFFCFIINPWYNGIIHTGCYESTIICFMYLSTTAVIPRLRFHKMDYSAVATISPLLARSHSRTCDFYHRRNDYVGTLFHYEYAIVDNTLLVKGVEENDRTTPAFSIPIGEMPLSDAAALLKEYCMAENIPLVFSAVPEDRVEELRQSAECRIEELDRLGRLSI